MAPRCTTTSGKASRPTYLVSRNTLWLSGGVRTVTSRESFGSEEGRGLDSIPSAMLEQEAHMLGLRDNAFPCRGIRSPQQMQTVGSIAR
jgi:hypothetical protein